MRCHSRFSAFVVLAASLLFSGCGGCQSEIKPAPKRPDSPADLFRKMAAAYQGAKTYQDQGRALVRFRLDGKLEEDTAPLAVKFVRPNRLSLDAYRLEVRCDAEKLRALITDPPTADLDGQVVERPAPAELHLADLLADEELERALRMGPCREPLQLALLLKEQPLETFLLDSADKKLLADEPFDGRPCHRVEVTTAEGPYIFWIDTGELLLRRLEYPAGELRKEIAGQLGRPLEDVENVELVAEFLGASFEETPAEKEFEFAMPAGAKIVRSFMRPPEPLPSDLFGRRPETFRFYTLDGKEIGSADLQGKVAVLVWFVSDEISRATLGRLNKVREKFAEESRVTFLAVSADPKSLENQRLESTVQNWGLKTPLARDTEEFGDTSFRVPVAPTLVVLDAEGAVQIFEPGANPRLETELPLVLERLLKGDNLAAELVSQSQREFAAYQRHLSVSGPATGSSVLIELPPVRIDPWQPPASLDLARLWNCPTIKSPGNLLVVEDSDRPPRILVCRGSGGLVELDAAGAVLAEHELPEAAGAGRLRSAVDGAGERYYLLFDQLGKQLHLYDGRFKHVLSFPPADQTHDGLRDAALCDLDGDGNLEIAVGYWGTLGAQAIDLAGKRLWSNRQMPTVLSLTATPPNEVGFRKLLLTGERGSILRLNQFGHADPEIRVGTRAIHHLYAAPDRLPRAARYAGLSYLSDRQVEVVALNESLQEQWSMRLPAGVHRNSIEYVAAGRLFDRPAEPSSPDSAGKDERPAVPLGQWVFAGANGSVHIVSDDGDFNDFFQTAETLSGLACTRIAEAGVLLVSSEKGVTAFKLELKREPKPEP